LQGKLRAAAVFRATESFVISGLNVSVAAASRIARADARIADREIHGCAAEQHARRRERLYEGCASVRSLRRAR
jgi:hypothetical protein